MPSRLSDIPGDLPDDAGLIALMGQDKKVVDGRLRLILAQGIGQAFVASDIDPAAIAATLAQAR